MNPFIGGTRDGTNMSKSAGVSKSPILGKTVTNPAELEKEFNKAARHIFKTPDLKVLTPEAVEACHHIGVKTESLLLKTQEQFKTEPNEAAELALTRFNHY